MEPSQILSTNLTTSRLILILSKDTELNLRVKLRPTTVPRGHLSKVINNTGHHPLSKEDILHMDTSSGEVVGMGILRIPEKHKWFGVIHGVEEGILFLAGLRVW